MERATGSLAPVASLRAVGLSLVSLPATSVAVRGL